MQIKKHHILCTELAEFFTMMERGDGMKLCVVGLGYICLPTAVMLANNGVKVQSPITSDKSADLSYVIKAAKSIVPYLKKGIWLSALSIVEIIDSTLFK